MTINQVINVKVFEKTVSVRINKETTAKDIISDIKEIYKGVDSSNFENCYLHCNNSPIYRKNELIYPLFEKGKTFYFGTKKKNNRFNASGPIQEKKSRSKSNAFVNYMRRKSSVGITSKEEKRDAILSKMASLKKEMNELNLPKSPSITNDSAIRLIKQIGSGSCSKVYSCSVKEWMCAVKVIPVVGLDIGNPNMFSEIEILENLKPHNNILNYISHTKDKEHIKIFTKLYQSTLANEIEERRNNNEYFEVKELIKILVDISAGIKHLHSQNVIHRDIKAQNIFVQSELDNNTYVIGDFDSAKQLGRKSRALSIIGTPTFMAPEVLNVLKTIQSYTLQADIFSFGMLMFHIMTLNIPYYNIKSFEVSNNIINGIPPEFPNDTPRTYAKLVNIFKECTTLNPEYRPNASQLHSKLLNLL